MSNLNVNLALAFTFMGSAARGVWSFSTLSNYLQGMTGSVLSVGIAEGVQGICQALVALLAGWYADKFSRDSVLQFAGVLGLLTIGFMMLTILIPGWDFHNPGDPVWSWMESSVRYPLLVGALGCWGSYQAFKLTQTVALTFLNFFNYTTTLLHPSLLGVWNTSLETIFADSVPMGKRSYYNTRKFVLLQMASISGPIVAICLFLATDNNWGQHTLTFVFFCGLLSTIPSIVCLFFFRDDLALPRGGASAIDTNATRTRTSSSPTRRLSETNSDPNSVQSSSSGIAPPLISIRTTSPTRRSRSRSQSRTRSISTGTTTFSRCRCFSNHYVPHVIVFSDLISGFGSGMTVKFFPLFFSQKLKLSPIATNSIYIAVPVFMTLASLGAQNLSRKFGRVQISMLYAYIGAIALLGMWFLGYLSNEHFDEWGLTTVLPLYFISTSQHCVRPLKKSILMDYVPKHQRARWNSLDSMTRFGWSGSAVVGGWIVDKWSYGGSFLITSIIQILASTMLITLLPLVPMETAKMNRSLSHVSSHTRTTSSRRTISNNNTTNTNNDNNDLSESLLNDTNESQRPLPPTTTSKGEDALENLNSTWHADHENWRSPSMGSDLSGIKSRSRSFDDHHLMLSGIVDDTNEDRQEGIAMAVYDALSEMQSPLMNSFVRRGDR